jgi:hypothetical protein
LEAHPEEPPKKKPRPLSDPEKPPPAPAKDEMPIDEFLDLLQMKGKYKRT